MALVVSIAIGVAIWDTHKLAERRISDHFATFRDEELEPELSRYQAALHSTINQVNHTIIYAHTIVFGCLLHQLQELYRLPQELQKETEELQEVYSIQKAMVKEYQDLTTYMIRSLSPDERELRTNCQNISSMLGVTGPAREAARQMAFVLLGHFQTLAQRWPEGRARVDIERVIDKLRTLTTLQ